MIELEKFDKVSKFIPSVLGLFIWMDGKVYLNDKLIYDKKPKAVYFYQGIFFIVENNWTDSIYIDSVSGLSKTHIGIDGMDCFIDKESILKNVWNDDFTVSIRQKFNLITGTVVWESRIGHAFILDEYFFGVLGTKLCRINPDTGQPIWLLDLPENYGSYSINCENFPIDVQVYIGIYNNCIYIRAGNKLILGIDINNGEEKFSYEYCGENVLLDNLRLDIKKGVIFSIGRTNYFELNLLTKVADILSIEETVKRNNVETTRLGAWKSNKVYFWEGGSNSKFGLFDRETKEIIFVHNLNVSVYPAIKDIKHGHGKIYVLDGNNSLHIFEL